MSTALPESRTSLTRPGPKRATSSPSGATRTGCSASVCRDPSSSISHRGRAAKPVTRRIELDIGGALPHHDDVPAAGLQRVLHLPIAADVAVKLARPELRIRCRSRGIAASGMLMPEASMYEQGG